MVFDLWTDDKAPNNGAHGDPFLASPKPRAQQDRPPAPPSLGRQGSSAGPMVKLLLGRTGADFLLLLEETDGAAHWQTRSWSEGGVPAALAAKLEKMRTKNHHVNEVSFGAAGEWFVHGVDAGGTSTFSWWDSAFAASRQLRKWTALPESRLHVAFGDEGRWLVLQGHNGFCGAEHVAAGLQKRIRKLHDAKGTIGVVRLLPGGAIFIGSQTPRAGSFPEASRSSSSRRLLHCRLAGVAVGRPRRRGRRRACAPRRQGLQRARRAEHRGWRSARRRRRRGRVVGRAARALVPSQRQRRRAAARAARPFLPGAARAARRGARVRAGGEGLPRW